MSDETVFAPGLHTLDLNFLGKAGVIASCLLEGPAGAALVDPGPASTLDALRRALEEAGTGVGALDAILITHIHLDHSGATGVLVRENPRMRVYVHERGAPHVIDPGRLIRSATQLYGEAMDRLWGEIVPVPASNVQVLTGGEHLLAGGRPIEVAYTPGHAWHHVSYYDTAARVAFVGDTGGIRVGSSTYLVPPTPPPDIDLDAWAQSLARIQSWGPEMLFVTHFGAVPGASGALRALEERLRANAALVRETLEQEGSDADRIARFRSAIGGELRRHMPEEEAARYELAVPLEHCWLGLARYWRKRG
jgi:glyoxylase-like metal-dependent hydrolase (beta-lactamase superfamily II)